MRKIKNFPLRDKKMESAATLQKLNLDMTNLVEEEAQE